MNTNIKNIIKAMITLQVSLCLLVSGCTKSASEDYIELNPPDKGEEIPKVSARTPSPITPTRTLLWSDEFNATTINTNKWEILHQERPQRKDPNGNTTWWHQDNAYLSGNGHLVIRTSKLPNGRYAGACIRTKGKFERKYGYFEIRVKLQKEQGHWGAFWLFAPGVNTVNGNGEDGTEIDVFESPYIGLGQNRMESALHYDGYGANHQKTNKTITDMTFNDGNWHTFGVEWAPQVYRFFYDGVMVWSTNFGGISKVPQYIKISDEVGSWGGILDITKANLPDYMRVDYVRVYDKR